MKTPMLVPKPDPMSAVVHALLGLAALLAVFDFLRATVRTADRAPAIAQALFRLPTATGAEGWALAGAGAPTNGQTASGLHPSASPTNHVDLPPSPPSLGRPGV
jgi:hypothetical protein